MSSNNTTTASSQNSTTSLDAAEYKEFQARFQEAEAKNLKKLFTMHLPTEPNRSSMRQARFTIWKSIPTITWSIWIWLEPIWTIWKKIGHWQGKQS
jgi:hypothetical protein